MQLISEYQKVQEKLKKRLGVNLEIPNKRLINYINNEMQALYEYESDILEHSLSVSVIGAYIGKCLDLTEDGIDELYIAGALHDIGKILIPKEIINKHGMLDEDERKVIESHPALSIWYLTHKNNNENNNYYSRKVLDMIRFHHEDINGNGYPYGIKKSQINSGAKIISIADKFEAYGAKRSYHEERGLDECIDFITRKAEEEIVDLSITNEFIFNITRKDA